MKVIVNCVVDGILNHVEGAPPFVVVFHHHWKDVMMLYDQRVLENTPGKQDENYPEILIGNRR
jgi:hypothetical protein